MEMFKSNTLDMYTVKCGCYDQYRVELYEVTTVGGKSVFKVSTDVIGETKEFTDLTEAQRFFNRRKTCLR